MALLALWVAGLFAYQLPGPGWLSAGVAVLWLLAALWTALTVARGKRTKRWTGFYVASVALAGLWWLLLTPRQDRDWADDVAQRLHVESFDGRHVVLDNVRDFTWRTETDYDARWVRREYDLDQLRSADLALSYWMGRPSPTRWSRSVSTMAATWCSRWRSARSRANRSRPWVASSVASR